MSLFSQQSAPIKVFYSYSHRDEQLRKELNTHLALLKRTNVITSWDDRDINAGKEWEKEISGHLNRANLVLLLVSADFIASDYCYSIEVECAMERHESGEARVIPIILRPCDWSSAPFGKLQALPRDAKPVTLWANQDEAFLNIAQGIRATAAEMASIHKFSITSFTLPGEQPEQAKGEVNPNEITSQMLVNALSQLLPATFDMMIFRLDIPSDIISSKTAPQRSRALEVIQWVETQDREVRHRIVSEIQKEAPRLLRITR
jgi:hypothetical protein